MKGFLRRDLYFLSINGKFYFCFMGVMAILAAFTDFGASFLYLYATIFCASSIMGLFSYDEANHWGAYAAAVPDGRRAQVDARYLAGVLVTGIAMAVMLLISLLTREAGSWALVLLYGGVAFIYLAVVCPLEYRFGVRSRLLMIILIAALAGAFGAVGGAVMISGGPDADKFPMLPGALFLIAVGLAGLVISRQISLGIVRRKEY